MVAGPLIRRVAIRSSGTGTTHFGRYVLNHSFMRPGLVTVAVSIAVGYGISALIA